MTTLSAGLYDRALVYRGQVPLLGGDVVVRHNDVSSFVLDVDAGSRVWAEYESQYGDLAGWHVRLYDEGRFLISGVITGDEYHLQDSYTASMGGVCHNDFLAGMVTLPSPDSAVTSQGVRAYYTDSGAGAVVIGALVDSHLGAGARAENRVPGLTVFPATAGAHVKVKTRFKPLLEEARSLALAAGTSFRTVLTRGGGLQFIQGVPRDLRRAVRFSEAAGSLKSFATTRDRPGVTRVIVGGQGTGTARTLKLVEGNTPNKWGTQRTIFVDQRQTDDDTELVQAGQTALVEDAETATVSLDLNDVPSSSFLTDFWVGDVVSVTVRPGVLIQAPVQEASLGYSAAGRECRLVVGDTSEGPDADGLVREVQRLRSRIRNLETQ